MTPSRLRAIGTALYGPRWYRAMANAIGCDHESIRRYALGTWPIPPGIAQLVEHELRRHRDVIEGLIA